MATMTMQPGKVGAQVGQSPPRIEAREKVTGRAEYTHTMRLPGMLHGKIFRSTVAHGRIKSIKTDAAKAMKGVLAVYTGADLTPYGTLQSALPLKSKDGSDLKKPPRPALPTDKVRFVGDPIACVIAQTVAQAKDAAEAIEVDIEPLPVVTTPEQATAPGAPALFDSVPGNICLDYHYGETDKVNAAFAAAKHKVKATAIAIDLGVPGNGEKLAAEITRRFGDIWHVSSEQHPTSYADSHTHHGTPRLLTPSPHRDSILAVRRQLELGEDAAVIRQVEGSRALTTEATVQSLAFDYLGSASGRRRRERLGSQCFGGPLVELKLDRRDAEHPRVIVEAEAVVVARKRLGRS